MNAIIISIGDELVSGLTVNTNASWLSEQLASIGVRVSAHYTVADGLEAIGAAIRHACDQQPAGGLLLITGGLGPTEDDLTREALAHAMRQELVEDPAALVQVERFFQKIGRPMSASNRRQALRPASARTLENTAGTAPGLRARIGSIDVYVMPGVPREMKEMFARAVLPALRESIGTNSAPQVRLTAKINTFGMGESVLGEKIRDLMARGGQERQGAQISVGTTVLDGIVSVRIYATGTPENATRAIEEVRREVHARAGAVVYSEDHVPLEEVVAALLKEKHKTIAAAESCTGGLVAMLLTNTAGSSDYFLRGWVTYANAAKVEELGVPAGLIDTHGAVSEEVARAMAEGARRAAGAEIGLSTTGIAGPGGGSAEKPVGTVWTALADAQGTVTRRFTFPGNRGQVRLRAAQMMLGLLRWHLLNVTMPV